MRNQVAGSNGKVAIKVDTAALSRIFGETGSSRKHCNPRAVSCMLTGIYGHLRLRGPWRDMQPERANRALFWI